MTRHASCRAIGGGKGWRFGATPVLLLLGMAVLTGSLATVATAQSAWPPPFTGWHPARTPVWMHPDRNEGMPAVDDGAVYTLSPAHIIVKRALSDGRELWRQSTGETEGTYGYRLAVAHARVLTGEWDLAAFDAGTGRHQWTFRPSEGEGYGQYMGAIDRDLVLAGSRSGHVAAVQITDGRTRWLRTVVADRESIVRPPVVDDSDVIAAYTVTRMPWRGGVVSLNLADGREQWRFVYPGAPDRDTSATGHAVVTDRLVFVASQTGEVYALDRRTGALQWTIPPAVDASNTRHPQHEHDYRTLALHKRILGITSFSGQVVGVDIDTRHEVWRFDGSALGSGGYELVPGHGSFYAPFFSGYLAALDAETGVLHWRTHDPALGFHRGPVVVGPDLVVAGESGTWRLRSQPPPQP